MHDRSPLSIGLGDLEEGIVVSRPNRFVACVAMPQVPASREAGREILAHVADSGRLRELIFPGNPVMVRRAVAEGVILKFRATAYDLVLARFNPEAPEGTSGGSPIWVSVDTRYPNRIFGQALRSRMLPEFRQYGRVEPEYWYHKLSPWKEEAEVAAAAKPRSRMDFYLESGLDEASKGSGSSYGCEARETRGTGLPPALVEVKSVTLCRGGVGLFPDAPTERGARHLRELIRGAKEGYRAYAVFIAQREDIGLVRPNREMDRTFADALREAQASGVSLLAFRCSVSPYEIRLDASAISVDPG